MRCGGLVALVLAALVLGAALGRHVLPGAATQRADVGPVSDERTRVDESAIEPPGGSIDAGAPDHLRELDELRAELAAARRALNEERARRIAREEQFLAFQRGAGALVPTHTGPTSEFEAALRRALDLPPPEGSSEAEAEAARAARAEADRVASEAAFRRDADERVLRFNALLRLHGVFGIDLLEPGARLDGAWGPVVFRTLDGDGRLAGHIAADTMHLVGTRAGRSLELVLTGGHTMRAGVREPFAGGESRLSLRNVDPGDFHREFPELFPGSALGDPIDDGRWSLALVRLRLNQMLAEHTAGARYRVAFLGGVQGDELLDLTLEVRDEAGHVERLLFADRARLSLDGRTAMLELIGGASQRGDRRVPFLDGRLRIVLPRVDAERWRSIGLPGLVQGEVATKGA